MDILLLTGNIRTDGAAQLRAELTEEKIKEYAEGWKTGVVFPSVEVCHDGKQYWLWDGFHRVEGARRAGVKNVKSRVTAGSQEYAQWLACGANATHGLLRTNEEKRLAVRRALTHPEGIGKSNGVIAKHCHVTTHFVAEIRLSLDSPQIQNDIPTPKNTGGKTTVNPDDSSLTKSQQPSWTENRSGSNGNITHEEYVASEEEEPETTTPPPELRTGVDGRTRDVSKIKAAAKTRKLRVVPKPQKDLITHDRFDREIPPKLLYVFNNFATYVHGMRKDLLDARALWGEVENEIKTQPFVTKHRNFSGLRAHSETLKTIAFDLGKDGPHCFRCATEEVHNL